MQQYLVELCSCGLKVRLYSTGDLMKRIALARQTSSIVRSRASKQNSLECRASYFGISNPQNLFVRLFIPVHFEVCIEKELWYCELESGYGETT